MARFLRNTETDVKRGTEETATPQLLLMRAPAGSWLTLLRGLQAPGQLEENPKKAESAHAGVKMALTNLVSRYHVLLVFCCGTHGTA